MYYNEANENKTKLYTLKDLAKMSQLTIRTLQNHLKEGLLQGHKIGRSWRFTQAELISYLEQGSTQKLIRESLDQEVSSFIDEKSTGVLSVFRLKQNNQSSLIANVAQFISQNIPDGLSTYKAFFDPAQGLVEITIIASLERSLQITQFIHEQSRGNNARNLSTSASTT